MPIDVTAALTDLLSHNLGPGSAAWAPRYGVQAHLDGDTLRLHLTFLRGAAYCCMEWGCHLGLHDGVRWHALRRAFAEHDVSLPPQLRLRLTCVIEPGSLVLDPPYLGGALPGRDASAAVRATHASRGQTYKASAVEASPTAP